MHNPGEAARGIKFPIKEVGGGENERGSRKERKRSEENLNRT